MAVAADFSFYVGEDKTPELTITGLNITGWTIELRVSRFEGGADLITKSATLTDPVNGVCIFTLAKADTINLEPRQYLYEIVRTNAGAETVLTAGKFTLLGRP